MPLVLVQTFDDPGEAHVARTMLEVQGIPAFLFEQDNPYPAFSITPLRLMVSEADAESALRLLSDGPGADPDHAAGRR